MEEVTFNVVLNEPNQLIHLDLYKPKQGFMIFALISGDRINEMELEIRNIEFYVEETDITDRPKDEGETLIATKKFHEISSSSYKYNPTYRDEHGVLMKRISFDFKNNPKKKPQHGYFDRKHLPIKLVKGEKLDFHITPKGFPLYKDYDPKKNINSHICNIKLYSDQ